MTDEGLTELELELMQEPIPPDAMRSVARGMLLLLERNPTLGAAIRQALRFARSGEDGPRGRQMGLWLVRMFEAMDPEEDAP